MADGRLDHEVHSYVEAPDPCPCCPPYCICGLFRMHHMHVGISSAVCTCLECEAARDPGLWARLRGETQEARNSTPTVFCSYQSDPWWDQGEKQWYVCTLHDGHDGDHKLCVATDG